jgi:succinyl-CoA synthetase beta subunit
MRLMEFQAKQMLLENGLTIPKGKLIMSVEELTADMFPALLKAQVQTGGRGKAGGIKLADNLAEAVPLASRMLDSTIKGELVYALLIEELVEFSHEYYFSLVINPSINRPVLIASVEGGVNIEQVAKQSPKSIIEYPLDLHLGIPDYVCRSIAKRIGINNTHHLSKILEGMYEVFYEYDATLVEINPLAQTSEGLIALDAKIILDSKASFRQRDIFERLSQGHFELLRKRNCRAELLAAEKQINYVKLEGDVGIISDGAGTGMLAIDLVSDLGGSPANFCELGAGSPERMQSAMEIVLLTPGIKVLFITLIGGMTRMDEMAQGIIGYLSAHSVSVPVVIRMCGTKEGVGKDMLSRINVPTFDNMIEAAKHTVALAKKVNHGNTH